MQQAVRLAAQSPLQLGAAWVLEVSHMGYLFGLFECTPRARAENARPGLLEKLGGRRMRTSCAAQRRPPG